MRRAVTAMVVDSHRERLIAAVQYQHELDSYHGQNLITPDAAWRTVQ